MTVTELVALLDELGREEPWYCCLFQGTGDGSTVSGSAIHMARSVIATRLWQRAAHLTAVAPDTLDVDTLRQCATTQAVIPPEEGQPPTLFSHWRAYYLTPPALADTARALDRRVARILGHDLATAPHRRFQEVTHEQRTTLP